MNINKLKEVYANNTNVKAVLDVLAKTKENTSLSKVDNFVRYTKMDRKHVVSAFNTLEQLGLGKFTCGRARPPSVDSRGVHNKGYRTESRFEWKYEKKSVAQAAKGVTETIEPMVDAGLPLPEDLAYLPEVENKPTTLPDVRKTESLQERFRIVDVAPLSAQSPSIMKIIDFDNTISHHVRLRKDLEVTISLPDNISKAELDKLVKYLTYMVDTND